MFERKEVGDLGRLEAPSTALTRTRRPRSPPPSDPCAARMKPNALSDLGRGLVDGPLELARLRGGGHGPG